MSSDSSIDRLKLAFAVYLAQKIFEADAHVDYQEMKLFGQIFPRQLLRGFDFIDHNDAFTQSFEEARQAALEELPFNLDTSEKLDLLTLLHGACMADGDLESRELDELRRGADLLGVSPNEFTQHLAQIAIE